MTDGITEAQDRDEALFGRPQVLAQLNDKGASATELCEGLRDAVRLFEDGIEPTDDLTVMALRYLGPDTKEPSGRSLPRGG